MRQKSNCCQTPGLALHTAVAGKCPSSPEEEQEKQEESRDRSGTPSRVASEQERFAKPDSFYFFGRNEFPNGLKQWNWG
ncbi:hypothetical protein TNCV_624251 [Trichonephila clavipes]|nr:hypothetical protein TNCV_624251 [Trichonephila clavipes]